MDNYIQQGFAAIIIKEAADKVKRNKAGIEAEVLLSKSALFGGARSKAKGDSVFKGQTAVILPTAVIGAGLGASYGKEYAAGRLMGHSIALQTAVGTGNKKTVEQASKRALKSKKLLDATKGKYYKAKAAGKAALIFGTIAAAGHGLGRVGVNASKKK